MRDWDWAPWWCPPIKGARSQMSETKQKSVSRNAESPRRRWSEAQRRCTVAESYRSGESASTVARRHGVHTSVLFRWRRRYRTAADSGAGFVPVVVEAPKPSSEAAPGRIRNSAAHFDEPMSLEDQPQDVEAFCRPWTQGRAGSTFGPFFEREHGRSCRHTRARFLVAASTFFVLFKSLSIVVPQLDPLPWMRSLDDT